MIDTEVQQIEFNLLCTLNIMNVYYKYISPINRTIKTIAGNRNTMNNNMLLLYRIITVNAKYIIMQICVKPLSFLIERFSFKLIT